MIPITDEEAQNWPLVFLSCSECGRETNTLCSYCQTSLCLEFSCIKAHASKGCYTNPRHADDSRPNVNQDPPPDARTQHDPSHAVSEPAVDAEAVEQPSFPKGR